MVPRLAPRRLRGHFSRRDVATTVTYTDDPPRPFMATNRTH